jgi:chromosome segregation ATPase
MDDMAQSASSDIEKQLDELKKEAELKTVVEAIKKELQEFSDKKPKGVDDYRKNYKTYKKDWEDRQREAEDLKHNITCRFENWHDILDESACNVVKELNHQVRRVRKAQRDQVILDDNYRKMLRRSGELEYLKHTLDWWVDANKIITDKLKAQKTKIEDTNKLLAGPDAIVSLYHMWFEILPVQGALAPTDDQPSAAEQDEEDYLDTEEQQAAHEEAGPQPPRFHDPATQVMKCPPKTPRIPPYLVHPDDFAKTLDDAWNRYRDLKRQISEAQVYLKLANDKLDAETKKLKDLREKLGENIKKALKDWLADHTSQAA